MNTPWFVKIEIVRPHHFLRLVEDGDIFLIESIEYALRKLQDQKQRVDCMLCGKQLHSVKDTPAVCVVTTQKEGEPAMAAFLCIDCAAKDELLDACTDFVRDNLLQGKTMEVAGHA